jgi:hypothetical protein
MGRKAQTTSARTKVQPCQALLFPTPSFLRSPRLAQDAFLRHQTLLGLPYLHSLL